MAAANYYAANYYASNYDASQFIHGTGSGPAPSPSVDDRSTRRRRVIGSGAAGLLLAALSLGVIR